MAWNRSSDEKSGEANSCSLQKRSGDRFPVRAAVAGAIVVVGAVVAAWWILSDSEPPLSTSTSTSTSLIREVKPAAAPKAEAGESVDGRKEELPPQRVGEIRNGYRLLPNGRMHRVVGVVTSQVYRASLAERIFDEPSDRSIGELLMAQPGDSLLGESGQYYRNFTEHFKKSLETKIVIGKNDDEDTRLLKESVMQVREELKAHLAAGDDLAEIMRESREQLREIGLYRDDLEKQVREIIANNDQLTEKDLKDLRDAANKMLEERGAKPLTMPSAFDYQMQRIYEEQN